MLISGRANHPATPLSSERKRSSINLNVLVMYAFELSKDFNGTVRVIL